MTIGFNFTATDAGLAYAGAGVRFEVGNLAPSFAGQTALRADFTVFDADPARNGKVRFSTVTGSYEPCGTTAQCPPKPPPPRSTPVASDNPLLWVETSGIGGVYVFPSAAALLAGLTAMTGPGEAFELVQPSFHVYTVTGVANAGGLGPLAEFYVGKVIAVPVLV